MKKLIKFMLLIVALSIHSVVFAEDPPTIPLNPSGPILGGNGGPQKSPNQSSVCPIVAYLNTTDSTIEFVSSENVNSITYYIYDEEDNLEQTEVILFDEGEGLADIATLGIGTYCLQIIVNGISYNGTFILY